MCDEDAYARSLARISVAQIVYAQAESMCEKNASAGGGSGKETKGKPQRGGNRLTSANNVSAQSAVVGSLADLLGAFIEGAGRRARARAEHAGRTKCSLPDVLSSLERGRPRIHTRDLATYARIESVQFPRSVPEFPAPPPKLNKRPRSEDENEMEKPQLPAGGEHWMPSLPPAHTYVSTPGVANKSLNGIAATGGGADGGGGGASRADLAAQRRSVGQSLARLSNPTTPLGTIENPYLQPPSIVSSMDTKDEERAEVRDPPEPFVESAVTESNRPVIRANAHESEAKRLRIERVMRESGGVTGVSAAAQQAAAAAGEADAKPKTEVK